MQLNIIALAFVAAGVFGALVREIYGNKGIFILPTVTDKGLVLGSLAAVLLGLGVSIGQVVMVVNITDTLTAISMGFGTGLGYTDLIVNILSIKYEKKPETG